LEYAEEDYPLGDARHRLLLGVCWLPALRQRAKPPEQR
jgi:hypothetical protein